MSGFRKNVSKNLARLVRDDKAPWQGISDPDGIPPEVPFNPATGKDFNGINSLILTAEMMERGSFDPRFMTRESIEEAGYTLREDSKPLDIEYWQYSNSKIDGEPEFMYDPIYNSDGTLDIKKDHDIWPVAFSTSVFHASDIEGIKPYLRAIDHGIEPPFIEDINNIMGYLVRTPKDVCRKHEIDVVHDQIEKSFYNKETSTIHLLPESDYENAASCLSSMIYHLGEGILNKLDVVQDVELSARIFAGIAASKLGIKASTQFIDFKDHADLIETDHSLIFRAAANGRQSFDCANDLDQMIELGSKVQTEAERMGTIDLKPSERLYLSVPFAEKDELKQSVSGAGWERDLSSWYVPKDTDPALIEKWDTLEMAKGDFKDTPVMKEFAAFIKEQGFDVGEDGPIMDGAWHSVPFIGETTGKAGMYQAFALDLSSGKVVNRKTPEEVAKWTYTGPALNPNDIAEARQKWSDHKIDRVERLVESHREASLLAHQELLKESTVNPFIQGVNPCTVLNEEGLSPYNVLANNKTGELMIEVCDIDGNLTSVQFDDGNEKRFIKGSKIKGCFHNLDDSGYDIGKSDIIIVADNYLDAASVAAAPTNDYLPVINALEPGNLIPVIMELNERYKDSKIFVLSDEHYQNLRNRDDEATDFGKGILIAPDDGRSMNQIRKEDGLKAVGDFINSEVIDWRKQVKEYNTHLQRTGEQDKLKEQGQEAEAGMGMGE